MLIFILLGINVLLSINCWGDKEILSGKGRVLVGARQIVFKLVATSCGFIDWSLVDSVL
jgi:hypothetical protein